MWPHQLPGDLSAIATLRLTPDLLCVCYPGPWVIGKHTQVWEELCSRRYRDKEGKEAPFVTSGESHSVLNSFSRPEKNERRSLSLVLTHLHRFPSTCKSRALGKQGLQRDCKNAVHSPVIIFRIFFPLYGGKPWDSSFVVVLILH